MSEPLISVVLPVYNGADMVREAIDGILAQTFGDFELIVIDDGSTDDTAAVVAAVGDPRLRFVRQENRGLAATLNRGILELARGRYVARQDHDDLSLPTRFERQVALLESDPQLVLVGCHAEVHDEAGPTGRRLEPSCDDATIHFDLMIANAFVHTSVMMRRDAVVAVGGYATAHDRQPEDYELWGRLSRGRRVANIGEALVIYRERAGSLTQTISFTGRVVRIAAEIIAATAGRARVDVHATDIAALVHDHAIAVSPRPDVTAMAALLRDAARAIAPEAPDGPIAALAERWIRRLRRRARKLRVRRWFHPELRHRGDDAAR